VQYEMVLIHVMPTDTGTRPSRLGGVSNETVKYGYGFCATRTIDYAAKCRPVLSSERAAHRNKTANFRQQHSDTKQYQVASLKGTRYKDILTDRPSVVK
jgi:hypothetical protein